MNSRVFIHRIENKNGHELRGKGGMVRICGNRLLTVRKTDQNTAAQLNNICLARKGDRSAIAYLRLMEDRNVLSEEYLQEQPGLFGEMPEIEVGGRKRKIILGLEASPEVRAVISHDAKYIKKYGVNAANVILPETSTDMLDITGAIRKRAKANVSLLGREDLDQMLKSFGSSLKNRGIELVWIKSTSYLRAAGEDIVNNALNIYTGDVYKCLSHPRNLSTAVVLSIEYYPGAERSER
jgi:cellobiose-specific phosphotransferase system component IIB